LHAGKLLAQYDSLVKHQRENYEATLLVCTLQSLLTICKELIDATKEHRKELWSATVYDFPGWLGMSRRFVKRDTFCPCELTYDRFIEHLRNAVSHPTSSEKRPFHPSTGYTTVPDYSGTISRFLFIDSPWVHRGEADSRACSSNEERVKDFAGRFQTKYPSVGITVRRESQGKYQIYKDEKVYIPVFEIEFSIVSLRSLMIELANYLAQPTIDHWDGKTIQRLVA